MNRRDFLISAPAAAALTAIAAPALATVEPPPEPLRYPVLVIGNRYDYRRIGLRYREMFHPGPPEDGYRFSRMYTPTARFVCAGSSVMGFRASHLFMLPGWQNSDLAPFAGPASDGDHERAQRWYMHEAKTRLMPGGRMTHFVNLGRSFTDDQLCRDIYAVASGRRRLA
jgi:hypothetical protein